VVPSLAHIERIWIDREVEAHPRVRAIVDRLSGVSAEVVEDVHDLKRTTDFRRAKRELILTKHRGRAFKPCQGIPCDDEHICCRYHVIDLISGCPMDCSYCILQYYLENNPRMTIYVNVEEILADIGHFLDGNSQQRFRIGTGELSDSLALDPIVRFADALVPFFAKRPNAVLELKTKTDLVDHLLDLPHGGHTVVAWSLNAQRIVRGEELGASSLEQRFAAARKCTGAGYRVAFHFDPIVMTTGSSDEAREYIDVIEQIFDAVEPGDIAWVSLGLLRLPYSMKAIVQRRFPKTRIFGGEIVPAGGKMRYAKFLRAQYYKPLWDALTERLPKEKIYLCMETGDVWRKFDPAITCHDDLESRLLRRGV
jgi:spore photoproduct lyase